MNVLYSMNNFKFTPLGPSLLHVSHKRNYSYGLQKSIFQNPLCTDA